MYTETRLQQENDRLKREAENARWERIEREEREQREREQQRRQRQKEAREAAHHADSWPEAFSKGLRLYRQEATLEARDNAQMLSDDPDYQPTTYFADMIPVIERAQETYNREMAEAEKKIADLRGATLLRIANLIEEGAGEGSKDLAQAFREDYCEFLTDW